VPAALMGMVTGIGGGMARDILAGRVPVIFRGELYATPALAGAAVAAVIHQYDGPLWAAATAGGLLCLAWRLMAIRLAWTAPMPAGPASA
jgi:uncharacterized membrane protein YeiH